MALAFHTFSWFTLGPWRSQGVALKALGTQNQRPARIEHLPMETMGQNGEDWVWLFPTLGTEQTHMGLKSQKEDLLGTSSSFLLGDPPKW